MLSAYIKTNKYDLFAVLLISTAVACVFGQTFFHVLIGYDDPYFISDAPHVMSGLSWENTKWAWRTSLMDIWHPLTWFSYQLESEVFGATNDSARFLSNAFLHLANALLVYVICKQLSLSRVHALIVSLLFVVHPQHVEVVAWVSERKELLASCFMLLSLWQYLIHQEMLKKRSYFFSLLFFIFALLSKASAAPLAVLLPIISFLGAGGIGQNKTPSYKCLVRLLLKSLPFIIVAIVVSVITIKLQASAVTEKLDSLNSSVNYLSMIMVRFAWYLKMSFWPAPISLFHSPPATLSGFTLAYSALIIAVFIWVVWLFRSNRIFLIGVSWFVLFLAPTSGIIPVEAIYVSDRYSYQAHIGLFIAILAIARNTTFGKSAAVRHALLFIAIAIFSVISWKQTALWKNSISLFEYEMLLNPTSDTPLVQLGYAYAIKENYDVARGYYSQAIVLNPDGFYGYAYQAFLEEKLANYAKAERLYLQAIGGTDPYKYHRVRDVYEHFIWVSSTLQKHEQAIQYLKQGLQYFPDSTYLQETKQYYEKYYPGLSKTIF